MLSRGKSDIYNSYGPIVVRRQTHAASIAMIALEWKSEFDAVEKFKTNRFWEIGGLYASRIALIG